ncbi:MAG: hypothetical protein GF411_01495 [Candidatus Lokiarchaeota archaeon]|nr:hypothetical protein [Candidatus Lokiarchaeota archaeon]
MKSICDLCGRNHNADSMWKKKDEQYCVHCAALQVLKIQYNLIPHEAHEEIARISVEIERMIYRKRDDETLPLIRKCLIMVNGMTVPESMASLVNGSKK